MRLHESPVRGGTNRQREANKSGQSPRIPGSNTAVMMQRCQSQHAVVESLTASSRSAPHDAHKSSANANTKRAIQPPSSSTAAICLSYADVSAAKQVARRHDKLAPTARPRQKRVVLSFLVHDVCVYGCASQEIIVRIASIHVVQLLVVDTHLIGRIRTGSRNRAPVACVRVHMR